ncbi:MAG: hypothetical protein PCFJNLEI_02079 [Verrucomicrobiae bacterium]|nr:hypothetical protein [Verrucomicrobiae bacterium]
MTRYLAIDNVCAWPNLTPMPDRRIIATIFNRPAHGTLPGDIECWESRDEGRFWHRCGVPAPHEPSTNRMNVAVGLARDGALIVIASGYRSAALRHNKPALVIPDDSFQPLPAWVCRSTDGGCTWTRTATFPPPRGTKHITPFGKIVQAPDGTLAVAGYARGTVKNTYQSHFYRSHDDGRTWQAVKLIGPRHSETDLLHLGGNQWLAAARMFAEERLDLFRSNDGGRSWKLTGPLTGRYQHPAHLLRLADGRILLSYGIRQRGFYGLGALVGAKDGQTWLQPLVLLDLDDTTDGGYPSTVQLADGSLLTAYYANGVKGHARYHMGVIRWNLDEQLELNRFKY